MSESMRAVVVNEFGGPDRFSIADREVPRVGEGQVLVKVSVAGVNYLDVAQRSGATPVQAPYNAGVEGVGTVVALGAGELKAHMGQRVGWLAGGQGAFAEYAVVDDSKVVEIPESISDEIAVSVLMQGITAHYLINDTVPVIKNDVVLVHAAAGGVGQMLTQLAKLRGATVIGTTSSPEKAEIARNLGADYVFDYDDFAERTRSVTGGSGAHVVFDGVGKTTFAQSLRALRVRGTAVVTGNASGPIPPMDINALNSGGSLYVTRPTVMHHIRTRAELARRANDIFELIAQGKLRVSQPVDYAVRDLAEAFTALESRNTTGKVILRVADGFGE